MRLARLWETSWNIDWSLRWVPLSAERCHEDKIEMERWLAHVMTLQLMLRGPLRGC